MVRTASVWYSTANTKKGVWYALYYSVEFEEVLAAMEKVNLPNFIDVITMLEKKNISYVPWHKRHSAIL